MTVSARGIINMTNRLPKELWMAIIGDDFRVYNRLVRAIPGLGALLYISIKELKVECMGIMRILNGHETLILPALNGQIHTLHPYVSENLIVHARYGVLMSNGNEPSFKQMCTNQWGGTITRTVIYVGLGCLSNTQGPAFAHMDTNGSYEIYAIDGKISRVRYCSFHITSATLYDANIKTATLTIIQLDAGKHVLAGLEFEDYLKYTARISSKDMSKDNVNQIKALGHKPVCVPIDHVAFENIISFACY